MKGSTIIKVEIAALPGAKVLVLNYRCRPSKWEEGTVGSVSVGVNKDGTYRPSYSVWTDRLIVTRRQPWGKQINLSVSNDGIKFISLS
jgi:hypothetical protein